MLALLPAAAHAAPRFHPPQSLPSPVTGTQAAAADLNGDGRLDLAAAAGDVSLDGKPDLIVPGSQLFVLVNTTATRGAVPGFAAPSPWAAARHRAVVRGPARL